jgi:hypothetical protein
MELLTPDLRAVLRANGIRVGLPGYDPAPVVKLFNPVGPATWLATELDEDGDVPFGLADLGFGCPELGYFSLSELARIRLPFGLGIERDIGFASDVPLSRWVNAARACGSILAAQSFLWRAACAPEPELPSDLKDG